MYYIYVIENKINGMQYVGQSKDPEARKRQHFSAGSDCPYVKNAVRKYGEENLDFIIIEKCQTLEEANSREVFWIRKLGTLRPNGYNLREGGDAGGAPSLETRKKMSRAQLGKKQSEETKRRRAESHRGRKNSPETIERMRQSARKRPPEKCAMVGKKHTTETRRRMSQNHTKEYCKRGHPLRGPGSDVWISPKGHPNCKRCRRFVRSGTVS
jgi:group I intron endonuclease